MVGTGSTPLVTKEVTMTGFIVLVAFATFALAAALVIYRVRFSEILGDDVWIAMTINVARQEYRPSRAQLWLVKMGLWFLYVLGGKRLVEASPYVVRLKADVETSRMISRAMLNEDV